MAGVQNRKMNWAISLLLVMLLFSGLTAKAQYGGGRGAPNDPYLIYTAEQMNNIGANQGDWNKHFKLMADIDLSGYTGTAFNIIGTGTAYVNTFTGVFDGNGHTISNFSYTSTNRDFIGLFGYVRGDAAVIKDLGLIDPNVDVGASALRLSGYRGEYIGSLVGELRDGTISNCYAYGGSVSGRSSVGGLVGWNGEGTITNCNATGSVTGDYSVGGLVGSNFGVFEVGGNITTSYSMGTVNGDYKVGGLVGYYNRGYIIHCYSTSTVNGDYEVGGLVGDNSHRGHVNICYSTGAVRGNERIGGLVGRGRPDRVSNSFWDIQTSGLTTSAGGTGQTTAEMQTASTFLNTGWDFVNEVANGTDDIWWILEGQDYPKLVRKLSAFSLYPQDGATDVTQPLVLQWSPGVFALCHEVYFGEDEDTVKNATTGSPEYKGSRQLGSESYDLGKLEMDTTYYWRIDEVNEADPNNPWKGKVWSFTTANFLIVEDFESYTDLAPTLDIIRIFNVWIDGYGDPTNGSLVGYDTPPFAEQTIVHSGNQSMPLYYDNSVGYSEATADIANLEIDRDWTIEGVRVLSLWFYGDPNNSAEPMYVALANANGPAAVVYHDYPDAAQIEEWTEWRIDLQAFANQGVNLTNIDTISIGFGNKNNPQFGGSGQMLFDDIRLYLPAEPEPEPEPKISGGFSKGRTIPDCGGNWSKSELEN